MDFQGAVDWTCMVHVWIRSGHVWCLCHGANAACQVVHDEGKDWKKSINESTMCSIITVTLFILIWLIIECAGFSKKKNMKYSLFEKTNKKPETPGQ